MCGIGGVVRSGSRELTGIGREMARRLHHRGPDALGVHPVTGGVLAHTRLKIIDLSEHASQPFLSLDGQIALSYNGEVYNFRELRARLQAAGSTFRSESDTEVVLELYRTGGIEALEALDGMFAFAIWDEREQRLVLMRDRSGKKPLYWSQCADGALVFGSEIKALTAYPGLPVEVDVDRIPEFLTYGYVSTPGSLYRGVRKLPPGSRLVLESDGDPVVERYWSLDDIQPGSLDVGVEEAKRLVRETVARAVKKRMVADVPVGAFLSGGIDSSVVVAEMARASATPVKTFAVGFTDDATYDETSYARDVAKQFGTEHQEIRVTCEARSLFDKLLEHHDEPYGDSSALAVHAVSEATRRHVTVALSGDGGDEVFAGYTRFRAGLVAGWVPHRLGGLASRALSRFPEPRGYKNPVALARRFVEHAGRSPDEQLLSWNSFFVGDHLRALLRSDVFSGDFDPWSVMDAQIAILEQERDRGSDRLSQILRHNFETYLLDDLLVKTDRTTMSVSLEARCPFLDTELVELAFRLPSALKLRFGQLKWLLREAYRDTLSTDVLDRQKHGFGVPVGRWWSGELSDVVDDMLMDSGSACHQYLAKAAIAQVVAEHRQGQRDHGQRIFALLQLELWLRKLRATPSDDS